MNEDIEKIIKYFKNDAWFTIFNAEELNDEPYKLLNPIEVNQIIDYMTKLQNNWNELNEWLKEYNKHSPVVPIVNVQFKMQRMEQGKDE